MALPDDLADLRAAHGPVTLDEIEAANDSMCDAILADRESKQLRPAVRTSLTD